MARFGQAATEFIIIIGVALVIVMLFFVISANMLTSARAQQNYDDARVSVQSLAEAADSVYAQGEGAVRKVAITLPGDTKLSPNYTYIGAPANMSGAAQNGININVNGTDVFGETETSLVGRFPNITGKYSMRVASRGSYVEIYPYLVDVDKYSLTIVMAQNATRSTQIVVTRVSGEEVSIGPALTWGFVSSIGLAISPNTTFNASEYGSVMTISLNSSASASGMYNSQLKLTATGAQSGTNETINIPISVNVVT